MAAGPALSAQLTLEVGAEDACLYARQLRGGVDVYDPVHPAHVDRDHRPRLTRLGLEAAGDARSAPERDDHGILLQCGPDDGGHLTLGTGAHHDVRQATQVPTALSDQVGTRSSSLARGPPGRGRRWKPDLLRRRPPVASLARRPVRQPGRPGPRRPWRGSRARARRAQKLIEGRKLGLALVREADVLFAPAPPLHGRLCRSSLAHSRVRTISARASTVATQPRAAKIARASRREARV